MNELLLFKTPVVVFLFTLICGVWLRIKGKPLNGTLFNLHKLVALSAVIFTARELYPLLRLSETRSVVLALIAVAVVAVIALFATGAFMSMEKPMYATYQLVHQAAVPLLASALSVAVFLLI